MPLKSFSLLSSTSLKLPKKKEKEKEKKVAKEASAPDTQAKEECFLGGHFLAFTLFFLGWGDEKLFLALSQCGFFWGIRRREKERKKGVLSPLFFFSPPP